VALHNSLYVYLIVSTVHVVTLALFVGTAAMLDLRLLGAALRDVPVTELARRLRPLTIGGFLLMLMSGALLFYANPTPRYQNFFFRTKMLLLALAGVNAWIFHQTVYSGVARWDRDPVPPRLARVAGGISLAIWAAAILSGRMVAYDFFDCRRQPQQPAIVNVVLGCAAAPR
jgi:hypothetical protein